MEPRYLEENQVQARFLIKLAIWGLSWVWRLTPIFLKISHDTQKIPTGYHDEKKWKWVSEKWNAISRHYIQNVYGISFFKTPIPHRGKFWACNMLSHYTIKIDVSLYGFPSPTCKLKLKMLNWPKVLNVASTKIITSIFFPSLFFAPKFFNLWCLEMFLNTQAHVFLVTYHNLT